jgi:tetratricopeptide (TPR) repeat protein
MDEPPHQSLLFAVASIGGILTITALAYASTLNPLADRRPQWLVLLLAMAPGAMAAAMATAYDLGTNNGTPTLFTWVVAPVAMLFPPLVVLVAEQAACVAFGHLARLARAREWRRMGVRATRARLSLRPQDRALQLQCGLLLAAEDEHADALRFLKKLGPAANCGDPERLRAMERCYRVLGLRKEATTCLEAQLRLNPLSQGLASRLLDDYLALDRPADALDLLDRFQLRESFARLRLRQDLHLKLGNWQQAFDLTCKIEAFDDESRALTIGLDRELLARVPDRDDVREHLGGLLLRAAQQEDYDEGAAILEDVLERHPDRLDLRLRLMEHYKGTGQMEQAVKHMAGLVANGTSQAEVYLEYAQFLQRQERVEEAARALERMAEALPDDWQGHARLARLRLGQERIEEAEAALALAAACAGQEGALTVEALRVDIDLWRRRRKIAGLHQGMAEGGADREARLELIDELIGAGRVEEVVQQGEAFLHAHLEDMALLAARLEAGLRPDPFHYRLVDYLADLYFQQDRHDDLLRLYRMMAAKALDPTRAMIEGCEKILARAPGHVPTRQELALARRRLEDWQGIIDVLDPLLKGEGAGGAAPEDRALWVEAAWRLRRLEEARDVGLEIAPALAVESGFMLLMIDILRALNDHAGAYKIYEMANAATPGDSRLSRLARRIDYDRKHQRLGQLNARAMETLTPEEHFEKAELHREFSQHEQAIVHFQKATVAEAIALPALGNMAVVMCENGMYELAAETLDPIELTIDLAERHPTLKENFYRVARAMERHKMLKWAVLFYKRLFRVDAAYRDVVERLQHLT